jgi:hypothetical protein
METKKTKLTISGKPRKNLYDNKGLTNNKKKQKFVSEKKFSKPFNKNNPGSTKISKSTIIDQNPKISKNQPKSESLQNLLKFENQQ